VVRIVKNWLSEIFRDRSPYLAAVVSRIGNPTYIWRGTTLILRKTENSDEQRRARHAIIFLQMQRATGNNRKDSTAKTFANREARQEREGNSKTFKEY